MIDFHCHLDLYAEPHAVTRACVERNIHVLSVTTTPSAWAGTSALAAGSSVIRTAVGLHPQLAHKRKGELALLDEILSDTCFVGEVGLDGAPEFRKYWTDQQAVFTHVLNSCRSAGGRILSIPSRRAATAVLDAIEKAPGLGVPILHWFSGTNRELARAIDLGCWFSVGPVMLRTANGRRLAHAMPRARVLTESDGPFAQIDELPVFPWDIDLAVRALSELWQEPIDQVCATLTHNLKLLGSTSPLI